MADREMLSAEKTKRSARRYLPFIALYTARLITYVSIEPPQAAITVEEHYDWKDLISFQIIVSHKERNPITGSDWGLIKELVFPQFLLNFIISCPGAVLRLEGGSYHAKEIWGIYASPGLAMGIIWRQIELQAKVIYDILT